MNYHFRHNRRSLMNGQFAVDLQPPKKSQMYVCYPKLKYIATGKILPLDIRYNREYLLSLISIVTVPAGVAFDSTQARQVGTRYRGMRLSEHRQRGVNDVWLDAASSTLWKYQSKNMRNRLQRPGQNNHRSARNHSAYIRLHRTQSR
jgi:hypothetical protein